MTTIEKMHSTLYWILYIVRPNNIPIDGTGKTCRLYLENLFLPSVSRNARMVFVLLDLKIKCSAIEIENLDLVRINPFLSALSFSSIRHILSHFL